MTALLSMSFSNSPSVLAAALIARPGGVRLGSHVGENEAGLLVRRYGVPLAQGRLIALDGEPATRRRCCPGMHFPIWRWQYKVQPVALTVGRPGG